MNDEDERSLSLPAWVGPTESSDCGRAEYEGGRGALPLALLPDAGMVEDRRLGW